MRHLKEMAFARVAVTALILSASTVLAQSSSQAGAGGSSSGAKCGDGQKCPTDSPCCSQYGQCGVGAYCLGGCDPLHSFGLDSCMPAPVCNSQDYQLTSLDGITPNTKYLGDASKSDWVSSGQPLTAPDKKSVILTLSEDGESASGTLLASSHYVWYGKVTATMKSSRGKGVVSAFILLSDSKDEIDFEFVGSELNTAQSNFYFQGITNYEQEKDLNVTNGGDTFSAWHTYEIDWKPDQLVWTVDGTPQRTLFKNQTFNKTDNTYHYPQTPARVQLSLWPAGISKNGENTIEWAGGLIDWTAQDPKTNGYYYAMYSDVNVECYDPPSGANQSGKSAYIYTNDNGTQDSIAITDDGTVLKSLLGTGTDKDKDYPNNAKASASGTKSPGAAATSEVATVPGLTGAGPGTDGTRGGGSTGDSGDGTGSAPGSSPSGIGGFSQGNSGGSKSSSAGPSKTEDVIRGSMFAVLVAFAGMLIL